MPDLDLERERYGHGLAISPVLDIRVVIFTLLQSSLLVALENRAGALALPRDRPEPGEPLDAAARRIARGATLLPEQYLEQLYTFSFGADENGAQPSVVVAYTALICSRTSPPDNAEFAWLPVASTSCLDEADKHVLDYALMRLRAKLGYTNIAFHLLPERFSLSELQNAYETILGSRLDKRNFRRRMIASGILEVTTERRREGSHRPAALYRFRADLDTTSYLTPAWSGPKT